jgi:hypothetical protein
MRAKATAQDFPLNSAQLFELDMGPKAKSTFVDEDELRAAWEANRDQILKRYAFRLHDAGWRPDAYWYFDAGDPDLMQVDGWREDEARAPARLRWLLAHDAFLPGELVAMRRRAKSDPYGYAVAAWKVIEEARVPKEKR